MERPLRAAGQIRVAIVEEREILRHGLVACLAEDRSLTVSSHRPDTLALHEEFDIAVVSTEAARRHRFACPVVVCTDDPTARRDMASGNEVVGVLHTETLTATQLRATVHAVAAGLRVDAYANGHSAPDALDDRAVRLLELIAEGLTTREIADRMSYSERTIKKLITALEDQMQARNRAQIVAQAIRRGLI